MNRAALIVDDDADIRTGLSLILRKNEVECGFAASAQEALEILKHQHFGLVFTDLKMPEMDGLELLRVIKKRWPKTIVIVITGFGSIETAVEAMSAGAYHYITKPFFNNEILITLERALYEQELTDELIYLRAEVEKKYSFHNLIGRDRQMLEVFELVRKVSASTVPVLIRGESGTGKELVARAIHYLSGRKKKRFFGLNTAALPDTLLEAELFGVRKGAFTGADMDREGLFVQVTGGTLFLDEIGSMSPLFQSKLLRALQEGEIIPLGTTNPISVDVRILAAANLELEEALRSRHFREDLYFRLNVVEIHIPPLRDRIEDIPLLVEHLIGKLVEEQGITPKKVTPAVLRVLMSYPWPGNVRELENVIHRAVIVSEGEEITHRDIVFKDERFVTVASSDKFYGLPYDQAKERAIELFQRDYVSRILETTGGNITHAAENAGMTRAALRRIVNKHSIVVEKENEIEKTNQDDS